MRLVGEGGQERRYGGLVVIVATALPLRLEDVLDAQLRVEGEAAALEPGLRLVHGVDVGKGAPQALPGRRLLGHETAQLERRGGRRRRGEHLLHLFHAGQLRQDRRALDGVGALELEPPLPGLFVRVVARPVPGAHVHDGDLEHPCWVARQAVQQLAFGAVRYRGVLQDLRKRQPEHGNDSVAAVAAPLDLVLEVSLVKDVTLSILSEEDDASVMAEVRIAIGSKGGADAGC